MLSYSIFALVIIGVGAYWMGYSDGYDKAKKIFKGDEYDV